MKVLLIKPRIATDIDCAITTPLGILYLAAGARQDGHEVRILDLALIRRDRIRETLSTELEDFRPDLVGLSAISPESKIMAAVARFVREKSPGTLLIAGGPHASNEPLYVLKHTPVDATVIGEGDITFCKILAAMAEDRSWENIEGIGIWQNGEIHLTPPVPPIENLDEVPFPAWDMVDFDRYRFFPSLAYHRYRYAPVFTSRGCPFHCVFCHHIFGKRFRKRSSENVLAELKLLYEKHNVHNIEILDDIFNLDLDRSKTILRGIAEQFPKMGLAFPNGVRMDMLDEEFMDLLAQANTYQLGVPFETGSPRMQKVIRKNLNLDKVKEMALVAKKKRIYTWGYFVIGFAEETREELQMTLDLADSGIVDYPILFTATPYGGTEMGQSVDAPVDSDAPMNPTEMDHIFGSHNLSDADTDFISERRDLIRRKHLLRNPRNWYMPANYFIWLIRWIGIRGLVTRLINLVIDHIPPLRRVKALNGLYIKRRVQAYQEVTDSLANQP